MEEDPIGYRAGDSNLYRYVSGNPLTEVDAVGLDAHGPGPRPPKDPFVTCSVVTGSPTYPASWFGGSGTWGQPFYCATGSCHIDYSPGPAGFFGGIEQVTTTVGVINTSNSGGNCNTVVPWFGGPSDSGMTNLSLYCEDRKTYDVKLQVSCTIACTPGGSAGGSITITPKGGPVMTGGANASSWLYGTSQDISVTVDATPGTNPILTYRPTLVAPPGNGTSATFATCTIKVISITPKGGGRR
jgi:hypothetical protein